MLCSNGYSEKICQFIDKKNHILSKSRRNSTLESPSMVYLHTEYEEVHDGFSVLANVCKRRDYCISMLESDYVLIIDADAKILDSQMFAIISSELEATPSEICIYKIKYSRKCTLPTFPIRYGTIDTLNFCISTKLAKKVGYPTTINTEQYGNDYWFIDRCLNAVNGEYVFIDRLFGRYNGNAIYLNLQTLLGTRHRNKILAKLFRSFKALIYRSLLNPFGL